MPGGKAPKGRGTSYEYRVRDFLRFLGWNSERNDLSGASKQIANLIGRHDVRASKQGIFLQLECKKTSGKDEHKIERAWLDKIDFTNDEILVFAFGRSVHYAIVPESVYQSLDSKYLPSSPRYEATGKTLFTCKRAWFDEDEVVIIHWKPYERYVATTLERIIRLIEKRGPLAVLKPIDFINSTKEIGPLIEWYRQYKNRLTNFEKCHYYGKLHRLEHGITDEISPEYKASVQWWRDTSDDVMTKCPHCNELITYRQLKENRDKDL
jgi:hypothetical protein